MDVKRILIKISGEALSGTNEILSYQKISTLCNNIKNLIELGIGVSIVIGGGNIIRGRSFTGLNRENVDSMGMLATSINGIALQSCFEKTGMNAVLMSNLQLPFGIENSNFYNIQKHMMLNKVIIFVGGAGQPYFSTDTISVINAITTGSDIILKATKTDGVYDKDPMKFDDAVHISQLTHKEAIARDIKIMDKTAFSIAMEHNVPIIVFSINESNCFIKALNKSCQHSLIIS